MNSDLILAQMTKQGLRITDQRKTLAKLFADSNGYLTPKDVYEHMNRVYSGLSFDTVYRNLRIMHELGILEQFVFEDGIKFRVHCQEHDHHHHLFCMGCERTVPLVYCPMDKLNGVPDTFQIVKHKFEVYGYCEECQTEDA
jgi:Fur family transcriptional regulator, zinc uptake regulator